jgi:hypothetical protein
MAEDSWDSVSETIWESTLTRCFAGVVDVGDGVEVWWQLWEVAWPVEGLGVDGWRREGKREASCRRMSWFCEKGRVSCLGR